MEDGFLSLLDCIDVKFLHPKLPSKMFVDIKYLHRLCNFIILCYSFIYSSVYLYFCEISQACVMAPNHHECHWVVLGDGKNSKRG